MSVERGLSPPEQYKIGIKYLEQLMKEDPNFRYAAPLVSQLKKEQRKVKKDWKYRGTSQEHRI